MATCKECLHYEACKGTYYDAKWHGDFDGEMYAECGCNDYKNKNKFAEMPCEVGDTVWDAEGNAWKVFAITIWRDCIGLKTVNDRDAHKTFTIGKHSIGKTIFLSIEDFTKRYLDTSDLEKVVEHLERYKKLKESEQEEQNG